MRDKLDMSPGHDLSHVKQPNTTMTIVLGHIGIKHCNTTSCHCAIIEPGLSSTDMSK